MVCVNTAAQTCRRIVMVGMAIALGTVGLATTATATPINVDFGNQNAAPSASFGAASGQAGYWNDVDAVGSGITGPLLDTAGNPTSVFVTISPIALVRPNGFQSGGSGDFALLMDDNFYLLSGAPYQVTFSGLSAGTYDVFLYDPENTVVATGSGDINGVGFSSINSASPLDSFVQNVNYLEVDNVTVVGGAGTLTLNIGAGSPFIAQGLAGVQLVPTDTAAVPEPATLTLLGTGVLIAARRRRRRQ